MNIPSFANRAVKHLIALCLFFSTAFTLAQEAYVTGIVLDNNQNPLPDVNISAGSYGTVADDTGYYFLTITSDQKTTITFSHIGHKDAVIQDLI
ncbi:MAG: carboxypeptidase-like regulatory domain-containing protein, partial [Bacteroidota bacterium]